MDLELWPFVRSVVGDALEDSDYDDMFREWELVAARKERFVAVTDARSSKSMPSSRQRARVAEWSKTRMDRPSRLYCLGSATVVTSSLARGAMTAINWLHKPPSPQAYFTTLVEGTQWCIDQLTTAGLPISDGVRAYHAELVRLRA
jgi:hypothetical protein